MVPLEYKGGMSSGMTEIIVVGVLALAIVALGLMMMRSLRKVRVPREDFVFAERAEDGAERGETPLVDGPSGPRPADGPEDAGPRR